MANLIPYKKQGEPGPRPSWFRLEMQELIRELSPRFNQFAKDVFDNAEIDPHVTKDGVVFTHASVQQKITLILALAKLAGFTDADSPLREPLQKVIDQVQAIKLMQELNYGPKSGGDGNGAASIVGNGDTAPHAEGPSAPAV